MDARASYITIRSLTPADIAAWPLSDEWLAHVGPLLDESAGECTGEPCLGMWALHEGDEIVGVVAMRRRPATGRLELCRLNVRPGCRGRGLGRRLVAHVLEHVHAHSNELVTAQVRSDNAPAIATLAAFEFMEVSRHVREEDGGCILLLEESPRTT